MPKPKKFEPPHLERAIRLFTTRSAVDKRVRYMKKYMYRMVDGVEFWVNETEEHLWHVYTMFVSGRGHPTLILDYFSIGSGNLDIGLKWVFVTGETSLVVDGLRDHMAGEGDDGFFNIVGSTNFETKIEALRAFAAEIKAKHPLAREFARLAEEAEASRE